MRRILGIDHGDRRVGIALSDPLKIIATPLMTIDGSYPDQLISKIENLVAEHDVELVVVGLPLGMKGNETAQTLHVKEFCDKLQESGIVVVMEDERLSSVSAKKILIQKNIKTGHAKGEVDKLAAAIILQQYLDKQ